MSNRKSIFNLIGTSVWPEWIGWWCWWCSIGHLDSLHLIVLFVCAESDAFARCGGWHSMHSDFGQQLHNETNHLALNYQTARNASLDSMWTCPGLVLPLVAMYSATHSDFLRLMHSPVHCFEMTKDEEPKTWPIDCESNPVRILMVVLVLLFRWIQHRYIDSDSCETIAAADWYRPNWVDEHRCQHAAQIFRVEQYCSAAFHLIVDVSAIQ